MQPMSESLILVVEDEASIAEVVSLYLKRAGYSVQIASDGKQAMDMFQRQKPGFVILDLMLPEVDGLSLTRWLRDRSNVPIIMLTARRGEVDRIAGLELGADDYVVKPFAFEELMARVRALLRRSRPSEEMVMHFADLTLNVTTREVTRGPRRVDLTTKEFDLLHFFMRHPRQVLPRELIYDRIWGYDFGGESNILEVYVRYLRSKLESGSEPRLIQTIRGVGYALREE